MPPPKKVYRKPHLSIEEQVNKLQSKNITFYDIDSAKRYLSHINYYRLSAYWKLYVNKNKDVPFGRIINNYLFDREFKFLVLDAIEYIETSLKAKIISVLTSEHGTHPHLKSSLFHKHEEYIGMKKEFRRVYDKTYKIEKEYEKENRTFIKHFKEKYREDLPPLWAIIELISFGTLSRMYANLKDRKSISTEYGFDSEVVFKSYIHQLTIIRNISAHQGRLWNRRFTLRVQIPYTIQKIFDSSNEEEHNKSKSRKKISINKIYNTLVFLKYMLDIIEPSHNWDIRLKELIYKYDIDVREMGFPKNWEELPVWGRG